MKKIILSVATLLIGFSTIVQAQEKTGVGIMNFTYVQGAASAQNVNSIQETVTNAFVKTKRFNIVDRSKMDAITSEKELQKTEAFMDGAAIAQGASLGASSLISGHVISASAEAMKADDGKGNVTVTYKAKLAISLKVIDVATGQVISSETIEPKSGNSLLGMIGMGASTPEAAISKAISGIQEKIDLFVSTNFPQSFSIAEIQEKGSKGDATKILIAGGSEFGLKKGDKLKVVEIVEMEVNGKKIRRKKEIGELKITKVEDENFSICSVNVGGIDINSKFEAKANLQIITKS
ncbi:CsgG/HfaB family protein [Flavobacterium sp. 5]|uniref:CsgG/HfaB family protein n=1 Tax=Flavobacterium sp. 5 TaxID=2035199 RepID=UPI000C2BE1F2|nr:CsgG/HfaB family protein [Flavobacterium sp. 5]PKB15486.1 Curli production assembly/transport component CsgG [Flavobacterium sp. 5]